MRINNGLKPSGHTQNEIKKPIRNVFNISANIFNGLVKQIYTEWEHRDNKT